MLSNSIWSWEHFWWMVPAAFIVDLLIGDPSWLPHPVVIIGKSIDRVEFLIRKRFSSAASLFWAGIVLWVLIVGGTFAAVSGILLLLGKISLWLRLAVETYLMSTALAARGLAKAALSVMGKLEVGNLNEARREVGWIVGRDTDKLEEGEIVRATVETVAENTSDGVVAPLFFAFLGGAPLAYAYKAVNTLDSMVGYKNEKYSYLGRFSARLDDLFNFLPARLSAVFLWLASAIWRFNWKRAFRTVVDDASKHPSPNGGYPEAVVAGALGIRLGGQNYYGGVPSFRAYLGKPVVGMQRGHIVDAVRLMITASVLCSGAGTLIYLIFIWA